MQLACNNRLAQGKGFNHLPVLQPLRLNFTLFCCTFIFAGALLAQNISPRMESQFKPESSILAGNYKKAKERTCNKALCKAIKLQIATTQESFKIMTGKIFA